jgi:hypothetical protein
MLKRPENPSRLPRLQENIVSALKLGVIALLGLPALISIVKPAAPVNENRTLSPFPGRPGSVETALAYPAKLDGWINDHFGFRSTLLKLNNRTRHSLFGQFPTSQVIQGKGRIFLAAHATTHEPYSAIYLSCGAETENLRIDVNGIAGQARNLIEGAKRAGINAKMLVAPSSPALYANQLPTWLAARCNAALPPVPRILASPILGDEARAAIAYPIDLARRIDENDRFIPENWFHWAGAGPRIAAEASTGSLLGIDTSAGTPLRRHKESAPSDISHLFPGVTLKSEIEVADHQASGIKVCAGAPCFPEVPAAAAKLAEVSRYVNDKAPARRLVLLSDSFGAYIAGWYSPYFREVVHLSTNNLGLLAPEDVAALRKQFLNGAPGDHVLFLYHDGSFLANRLKIDQEKLGL